MDAAKLKTIPLFSTLSDREREDVARWADEVDVPEGKELGREGTFAYEWFVIREGTAEVRKGDEVLTELGPNDFFGEIGLLETERRTATVVAKTPMQLIVMFGRDFKAMRSRLPDVCEKIEEAIRERLARG